MKLVGLVVYLQEVEEKQEEATWKKTLKFHKAYKINNLIKMFLFKCCQSVQTGHGYAVKKRNKNNEEVVTFINSLNDVDRK